MSIGETLSWLSAAAVAALVAVLFFLSSQSSNRADDAYRLECVQAGGSAIVASGGAIHCVRPGSSISK